jgi:ketosteroid isomerase-like protein
MKTTRHALSLVRLLPPVLAGASLLALVPAGATGTRDADVVAALDTEYQAAVLANDAVTMDRILADDFTLVLGNGVVHTKKELIDEARRGIPWEQQNEIDDSQRVRVWGDTAVVTAKLWVKGTRDGKTFDRKLWFSDTYVRTKDGWRYVFGQASLPLPSQP